MVCIINSPLFKEKNLRYDEDSLPPIGLGYIATHLQNEGINVKLIDAVDDRISLSDLIDKLNLEKPKFIASNIFTTNYELVRELIESITYKTHFIIGGLSTKDLHNEIIHWKSNNQIDIVVGDGELITLDIVKDRVNEKAVVKCKNRRVFNVFSNSNYYLSNIDYVPLNRTFFKNEPVIHPFGFHEVNIIASRGCIFNCTFCAAARSLNEEFGIRERSADSLKAELRDIEKLYPEVNSIRILDDLFLKNSRCVELAINVFSNNSFQWRSMAHVTTFNKIDKSTLRDLKKSGCKELFIGIESGSPKILKSINKTHDTGVILKNLIGILRAGINIKGYFIYGIPEESHEDMDMTYELACKLKTASLRYGSDFRTSVFQYRPYHGTAIYHNLISKGIQTSANRIEPDDELSNLIGRIQFNFHSGNYSDVALRIVHDYIYRTTKLTDPGTLSRIRSNTKSQKQTAM